MFKKILTGLSIVTISVLAALLLFEVIYRYQLIDLFRAELQAYNSPQVLNADRQKTLLVMGDSFSAGNTSYPAWLRVLQDDYRVINAAVPGTGIFEATAIAARRFERFQPSLFIYQIYVGNDLYNIRYPVNWNNVSLIRNLYWSVAQRLRSVWFINYKNGQIAQLLKQSDGPTTDLANNWDIVRTLPLTLQAPARTAFSSEQYTRRDKIMLQADPAIIDQQINVSARRTGARRAEDYQLLLNKLSDLLQLCQAPDCRAYILVIPHAVQVDAFYRSAQQTLGALFAEPETLGDNDYPFVSGIRDWLQQHEMDHVELLNPLAQLQALEQQGKAVYYSNDSHLNDYGQQQIAKFIVERIGL